MDDQYKSLYKTVNDLYCRIRDYTDEQHHPHAVGFLRDFRTLADDVETKKNPHSLEDRIKHLQQQSKQLRGEQEPIMDHHHLDEIHDQLEHIRMELRKFSNY